MARGFGAPGEGQRSPAAMNVADCEMNGRGACVDCEQASDSFGTFKYHALADASKGACPFDEFPARSLYRGPLNYDTRPPGEARDI